MTETERLRLEVEQLRDECHQLNVDLTEVNQLVVRLVGVCEKQVAQVDKLLSIVEKK